MLALKPASATNLILLPKRGYQECPLCHQKHPIMMRGLVQDMEDDSMKVTHDRGYSFCNCNNIFFTDWKNINQSKYDETYSAKYNSRNWRMQMKKEYDRMMPVLRKHVNPKSFFEIGCIHDHLLSVAKADGLEVSGLDIVKRPTSHNVIFEDVESFSPSQTFDIVWASHIIEHLKDPKRFLEKMRGMLGDKGVLYLATPDTFFIDFEHKNPLAWDWVVDEHYILWGMESLIDFAATVGLKCVYHERNIDLYEKMDDSVFWKNDMKLVFKNG
jgi:2-polyprenyl-3-methyl-5-hydroxy-6-metoxy-1,4-benzoquinol methylase